MSDLNDDNGHRTKRFKYQSYGAQLKTVHPPPTLSIQKVDQALEHDAEQSCLFHAALSHWMQLNLSPEFLAFAHKTEPLSRSLALLLHSWKDVIDLWVDHALAANDEALRALFDLLQKFIEDLRTTITPSYHTLVSLLLSFLTRTLSPESLSALLSVLLALFKHVLVPSVTQDVSGNEKTSVPTKVESTWELICSHLQPQSQPSNQNGGNKSKNMKWHPEVQRAVAESWSSVLRRLKKNERTRCIHMMMRSLDDSNYNGDEIDDFVAWSLVHTTKSVAHTVHTSAPTILSECIDYYLSLPGSSNNDIFTQNEDRTFRLIRRVVTALLHHVSNQAQFTVVADALISRFAKLREKEVKSFELDRILAVLVVPCSVRQGSRLSTTQLSQILEAIRMFRPSICEILNSRTRNLQLIITSALCSQPSDLSVWMNAGRLLLEQLWSDDKSSKSYELVISLTGSLYELGWKGFQQFAIPPFMKNIPSTLDNEVVTSDPIIQVLRILARMAEHDILRKNMDEVVRGKLEKWAQNWLSTYKVSEESNTVLKEILSLIPFLSSSELESSRILIDMALEIILSDTQTSKNVLIDDYQSSWANKSWAFGSIIHSLSVLLSKSKEKDKNMDFSLKKIVCVGIQNCSWSEFVMEGLSKLAKSLPVPDANQGQDIDSTRACLEKSLNSYSHVIRRSSLELLVVPWLCPTSQLFENVMKGCLVAEMVPLGVQSVRERVLRTEKISRTLPVSVQGSDVIESAAIRACVSWLIGQLKINLRPLWTPAAKTLATIAERYPDIVWSYAFNELRSVNEQPINGEKSEASCLETPGWVCDVQEDDDVVFEEERTWRDPSGHKMRNLVFKWVSNQSTQKSIIEVQRPKDRFDPVSYEAQLLSTINIFSSLAEKHNRELVPLFLSSASYSSKSARIRIVNWLTLFSKFSNPKAFYLSDKLLSLYTTILSHPDRTLQRISLACLLTYKSSILTRYKDKLNLLLDDTKWRDELASLEIQKLTIEERKEFIPILVRMFYGLMREKGGRGKGGDRRTALLSTLGSCDEYELGLLVELMTESLEEDVESSLIKSAVGLEKNLKVFSSSLQIGEKQQIGFLILLGDVLKNLGSRTSNFWDRLVPLVLSVTAHSQEVLQSDKSEEVAEEIEEEADDDEIAGESALAPGKDAGTTIKDRQHRLIRQLGLKRLTEIFRLSIDFDFTPYLNFIFNEIVSPRVDLLDRENTQAPSALFELFDTWSHQPNTALYLAKYDQRILGKIYDCLIAKNVKPVVVIRIYEIVERLIIFSEESSDLSELIMKPYLSGLLKNISLAIHQSSEVGKISGGSAKSETVIQKELSVLARLSPYISNKDEAISLLSTFLPQLRKGVKDVPEAAKVDILTTICHLIPQINDFANEHESLYKKTFETLSFLFQHLKTKRSRLSLLNALKAFSSADEDITSITDLLTELNSYSTMRMEEPDFDRRLLAFANLNEERWDKLSGKEWTPLLHNMLYFVQDEQELSMRSNASLTVKHFLDILSTTDTSSSLHICFVRILFPGIKRCLKAKHDLVRAEVMGILAHSVTKCSSIVALQEMRVLLASGDEEANFFNNIFHVQIHRRNRALRRLADFCDEPGFRNSTLKEIFIPVVNSFIAGTGSVDHHLVNEAILTLGRIAKHLNWQTYFSLVQQYIKLATDKTSTERTFTRALVSILDNFHFVLEDTFQEGAKSLENENDEEEVQEKSDNTVSSAVKIHDAVNNRLLPTLLRYLEKRDELEEANRIPLAIGIAKISLHLPEQTRDPQITKLLTVLSQIFRSKSQETRDSTRETLCRIAAMLNTSYLPLVVKQLREALPRGPHLHVLAFVTHAVLAHITSDEAIQKSIKLDECVPDVVHVSAEVVLGQSGKDVESEGFKTKMKEVRKSSSMGMDSFAILAKYITPKALSDLLLPLKAIMQETESVKVMQKVDEVLRRIAVGLNANANLGSADLLTFCYTLISQNAEFFRQAVKMQKAKNKGKKVNDAIVNLKRKVEAEVDHYSLNSWRFVVFGLELFNTAIRRSRFDFHDKTVIARLEPMVNVIGNTLYASNGEVISSGLKATAQIIKCPLKNVEKSLPVFVRQILEIVKQTGGTESNVMQNALRTLSVVIRDCPSSQLKEKDLTFLLEVLTPDLEEVTRQGTAFNLLRSIVSRKFVVPEIYDLMGRVSEIMVTSQSAQVQELCRSVLLTFLLDYPQGKGRLRNQFTFLVKNLSYVFESGRSSVLELLGAAISKFSDSIIEEYADMLFVALVLVLANDESQKCREMAAQLLKALLGRLEEEQRKTIMAHIHSWASQADNTSLARVSLQAYGLVLDVLGTGTETFFTTLQIDLYSKIREAALEYERITEDEEEEDLSLSLDWQMPYQALNTLSKVFQVFPDTVSTGGKVPWSSVTVLLLYPHAWVRTAACRLLGSLYSKTPVGAPGDGDRNDPLSEEGMREIANALTLQLKSENLDEPLALQVVKNLFYIGKCFCEIVESESGEQNEGKGELPGVEGDESVGEDEDEDSEGEDETGSSTPSGSKHPLPWLFSRLSYQARSAHIYRTNRSSQTTNWTRQPSAIFRWFAAMASYMENTRLERYLLHILSPIYRIIDDKHIRDSEIEELKTLASEVSDLVQSKVGTTAFAATYSSVRQHVESVRRERRVARNVQMTTNPEAAMKRRISKNKGKKDSRKRKNNEFADKKIRMRFTKRRKVD